MRCAHTIGPGGGLGSGSGCFGPAAVWWLVRLSFGLFGLLGLAQWLVRWFACGSVRTPSLVGGGFTMEFASQE